jgi:hypothetical protein
VERTIHKYPFLVQNGKAISSFSPIFAGAERLFIKVGKMHDDHKKSTEKVTFENQLLISMNYPDA